MSRSLRFHRKDAKIAKNFVMNRDELGVFAVQIGFSAKRWQLGL
jgi:hypothetical protein